MKQIRLILLVSAVLLTAASCATMSLMPETRNSTFVKADEGVKDRDYAEVAGELDGKDSKNFYGEKDQVLRYLDSAMLYHLAGRADDSTQRFQTAEDLIEANYTKSITNAAASFLLNDTALEYFGEAYEDLYINVFKALDYIRLGQYDDAFVEIHRLDDKLNHLEDKYGQLASSMNSAPQAKGAVQAGKTEFHNSALARYLSMILYRSEGQADNAAIDEAKLKAAFTDQPSVYPFPVPPLTSKGKATGQLPVDIISFTGKSPVKKAYTVRMNTLRDMILVSEQRENDQGQLVTTGLAGIPFPGAEAGLNFKCQLPQMSVRDSKVRQIKVLVDGAPAGQLALLERMDRVALETFKLSEKPIFYKTVIRTVVKGLLAAKASAEADKTLGTGGLLGLAMGLVVDASEQADLRSARYLPGQAYVGQIFVSPGEHVVSVEYYGANGLLLYSQVMPSRVFAKGKLNLVDAYDLE